MAAYQEMTHIEPEEQADTMAYYRVQSNAAPYEPTQSYVTVQQQQPESYGHYASMQIGYVSSNKPDSSLLETAILAGRAYAPPNASYVPGELVARGGIATLYDSCVVPTFESDLHFVQSEEGFSTIKEIMARQEQMHQHITDTDKRQDVQEIVDRRISRQPQTTEDYSTQQRAKGDMFMLGSQPVQEMPVGPMPHSQRLTTLPVLYRPKKSYCC